MSPERLKDAPHTPHGACSRCGAALTRIEGRDRSHVCASHSPDPITDYPEAWVAFINLTDPHGTLSASEIRPRWMATVAALEAHCAAHIEADAARIQVLRDALREMVTRCDGAEGVRADGSNIDTTAAHAALGDFDAEAFEKDRVAQAACDHDMEVDRG